MDKLRITVTILTLIFSAPFVIAAPSVGETIYLGPLTGIGAPLHPDNLSPIKVDYHGTDAGWTYEHNGKIQFLFGDTRNESKLIPIGEGKTPDQDDIFGTIDLSEWSDPDKITPDNIPRVKLAQKSNSRDLMAVDPEGSDMGGLKIPLGGFSNGDHEFALLSFNKPLGCMTDADCGPDLSCDNGLGTVNYANARYDSNNGNTLACFDGRPGCIADTMYDANDKLIEGSGFCVDKTSSYWADTPGGRVNGIATRMWWAIRNETEPEKYKALDDDWFTNKFNNTAIRTVESFVPENGSGYKNQNYNIAAGADENQKILLWGRPGFMGIGEKGRDLNLYFAYVDMPVGSETDWEILYYTGIDKNGIPQFSNSQKDATALDLDSTSAGVQANEIHDAVQQMSIVWIDHFKKWIMFYGGGITKSNFNLPFFDPECGITEVWVGKEDCKYLNAGNGAIRMRTADNPWGPWTPSQDVVVGGDPNVPGSGHYKPGGALRHPACTSPDCAPHSPIGPFNIEKEYGWFYGVNIIEQWNKAAGDSVDVIWNVSTWNPYRVVLFKTRINP